MIIIYSPVYGIGHLLNKEGKPAKTFSEAEQEYLNKYYTARFPGKERVGMAKDFFVLEILDWSKYASLCTDK